MRGNDRHDRSDDDEPADRGTNDQPMDPRSVGPKDRLVLMGPGRVGLLVEKSRERCQEG